MNIEDLMSGLSSAVPGSFASVSASAATCASVPANHTLVGGPQFGQAALGVAGTLLPTQSPVDERLGTGLSAAQLDAILTAGLPVFGNLSEEEGIDAYAWYQSFRFNPNFWGVFIPVSKLVLLTSKIYQRCLIANQRFDHARVGGWPQSFETLKVTLRALLAHEYSHFAADYAIAQLEICTGRSIYLPASPYLRSQHGHKFEEEKFANAAALRSVKASSDASFQKAYSSAFEDFTRKQPGGYAAGVDAVKDHDFFQQIGQVVQSYGDQAAIHPAVMSVIHVERLLPWAKVSGSISSVARHPFDWTRCPVYLIEDQNAAGLPTDVVKVNLQC